MLAHDEPDFQLFAEMFNEPVQKMEILYKEVYPEKGIMKKKGNQRKSARTQMKNNQKK